MSKAKDKYKQVGKNLAIKAIRQYINRFMLEVDILSGEEKRLIMEEMERIAIELKEKGKEILE